MPDEPRRCGVCQYRRRKGDDRRYRFGLLGHLSEVCQGAGVQAQVWYQDVPKLPGVEEYIAQGAVPGGTQRNFASYGHLMGEMPRVAQPAVRSANLRRPAAGGHAGIRS